MYFYDSMMDLLYILYFFDIWYASYLFEHSFFIECLPKETAKSFHLLFHFSGLIADTVAAFLLLHTSSKSTQQRQSQHNEARRRNSLSPWPWFMSPCDVSSWNIVALFNMICSDTRITWHDFAPVVIGKNDDLKPTPLKSVEHHHPQVVGHRKPFLDIRLFKSFWWVYTVVFRIRARWNSCASMVSRSLKWSLPARSGKIPPEALKLLESQVQWTQQLMTPYLKALVFCFAWLVQIGSGVCELSANNHG